MIKFLTNIWRSIVNEPIGCIAAILTIVPFIYEQTVEKNPDNYNYNIQCDSLNYEFRLHEGILYFRDDCYFSSLSDRPVSIVKIYPALFYKKFWSRPMMGDAAFYKTVDESSDTDDFKELRNSLDKYPIYIQPFESHKFEGLFAFPIGKMFVNGECRDSYVFPKSQNLFEIRSAQYCDRKAGDTYKPEDDTFEPSIHWLDAIYGTLHFSFEQFNNFGMVINLSTGQKINFEANLNRFRDCAFDDRKCEKLRFDEIDVWEGDWVGYPKSYAQLIIYSLLAIFLLGMVSRAWHFVSTRHQDR